MPKHVPPSRKRYHEEHPNVTVSLDREQYAAVEALAPEHGGSKAAVLREALVNGLHVHASEIEAAEARGYVRALADAKQQAKAELPTARQQERQAGFEEAEARYLVEWDCARCGEPVALDRDAGYSAIEQEVRAVLRKTFAHNACTQRPQQYTSWLTPPLSRGP